MKPSLTSQNITRLGVTRLGVTRLGVTPPQAAIGCACLIWALIWLWASSAGWPPRIVGSGLLATGMIAGWLFRHPATMLIQAHDSLGRIMLRALWSMSILIPWLFLGILFLASLLLPNAARADETDLNPVLETHDIEAINRNMERYRADIDALIKGAPSFADSQQRLTTPHTLPGDPLAGMEPAIGNPGAVGASMNTSTLMVFLTLSMPDEALAGWLDQTARAGGVAVIRGFYGDKLSVTLKRLTGLQELAPATKTQGGVSIDPTAFTRFDVDVAPTVIVASAPLPPCSSPGCNGDPTPAHDRIAGNITLNHALALLAQGGDQARQVAMRHLKTLEQPRVRPTP